MVSIFSKIKQFFCKRPSPWLGLAVATFLITISFFTLFALNSGIAGQNIIASTQTQAIDFEQYFDCEQFVDSHLDPEVAIPYLPIVVPLYSKLNTSLILGNTSRADILNLITTTPGITLGAITRELNLKTGTAAHHLRILEREGYIKVKKTGKFKRYYLVGTKASGFNELQDQIIQKIEEHPGLSQSELAQELSTSRQLINYHLQQLISSKVILIEKIGNKSVCFHV